MTLELSLPDPMDELRPRITVIGVGGAGGNAVNNMIRSNLTGVEFIAANTDSQALGLNQADLKIQLGLNISHGLGAGSRPDIGRAGAEEALDDILAALDGCHMVFITAGMGGGTGTGAAPIIARAARENGILTVGVVTKPFHFEGRHRMRTAEAGIEELASYVDTLIVIPNQNLFRIASDKTTFADAFQLADDVLHSGVRGVTDLMVKPGLINLDFADIRSVMREMGKAMMGTGEAHGDNRAVDAAEAAISNPLLDDASMKGARGVLINITGGADMTLFEVDEAANRIRDEVDPEANIIFGATSDDNLDGVMRVSVVATGIDGTGIIQQPVPAAVQTEAIAQSVAEELPVAASTPVTDLTDATHGAGAEGQTAIEQPFALETFARAIDNAAPVAAEDPPSEPVDAMPSQAAAIALDEPESEPAKSVRQSFWGLFKGTAKADKRESVERPSNKRDDIFIPEPAIAAPREVVSAESNVRPINSAEPVAPQPAPSSALSDFLANDGATPPIPANEALAKAPEEGAIPEPPDDVYKEDVLEIPAFLRRQAN